MPNIINNTSGLSWYGFESVGEGYEKESDEAHNNAFIVRNMCEQLGWSINAISALCGNIEAECNFNPMQHELLGYGGFGLMQWTPSTDLTDVLDVIYPEGYNWLDGTAQMNGLFAEYQKTNYEQGYPDAQYREGFDRQWYNRSGSDWGVPSPVMDWYEWAHDTVTPPDVLAIVFMASYLRCNYPIDESHYPRRMASANYFYSVLTGEQPPTPTPTGRKKLPIWMYTRKRKIITLR